MKKRISLIFLVCMILVSLVALSSCGNSKSCDHEYEDATCTTPKTCSECGKTKGEPLGHSFKPATCTEPETCTVCSATQGAALGHSFKAATCTEPATCTTCYMTQGTALGHKGGVAYCNEKAVCDTCHEEYGEVNSANHKDVPVWQKRYSEHWQEYKCCGALLSSKESHNIVGGTCNTCGYDPSLIVSSAILEAGETEVVLTISVVDNIGIIGLDLTLLYEDSVLTLVDVTAGDALSELEFSSSSSYHSGCKFLFDGVSIEDKNIRDGEVLVLTFSVSSDAVPGEYSVYVKAKALDNDLNSPSLKLVSGTVTIK